MSAIIEDHVERLCVEQFENIGFQYKLGHDIAPDGHQPERADFNSAVLQDRLHSALVQINPHAPDLAIESAFMQLTNPDIAVLMSCNRQVHDWLRHGISASYLQDGEETGVRLNVFDFDNLDNNDWLVVNQFSVQGSKQLRRPDVVIFVNGLPLAVIELKNPANQQADIWSAFNQLQTYKNDIPDLFHYNVCLIISDGLYARMGSIAANEERFLRWRTIDGNSVDPLGEHRELETLIKGFFRKEIFLNFLRYFCVFEEEQTLVKKIAAYHQFHAVQAAVDSVLEASGIDGTKKGGVVWHTQGAGKSLEMACLAGRLMTHPTLANPTIIVVTDRLNLDGQLFNVFAKSSGLLGEPPKQVNSRIQLRDSLLNRPSGGIIFTTIQKFGLEADETSFPVLSPRHNVIVIVDEAHRTHYGFKASVDSSTGQIKYGLARSLRSAIPNATFVAFTGTPISQDDRDTRAVFGEYIDIYDIQQAVDDGATVPIYYESRLAKIKLDPVKIPQIDEDVEEILDDETADEQIKERAKSQWTALEAIVGTDARLELVAKDLIAHYDSRNRTQRGKALIVTMSREICVRLYEQITKLRPEWHSDDHRTGEIKVVMTASAADKSFLQQHHTNNSQKKDLENRFKDPADPLKIVIVRDMWLTGFDAPCLATMYVDKPMHGANLAQAIARVNRVFKDKPGGLVVDYIGIAAQLKEALATYTAAKGRGQPTIDVEKALEILKTKLQVVRDLLHPVDWSSYRTNALQILPTCLDHILSLDDGKRRYCDNVLAITKAFALCGTLDEAGALSEEVAFHQAARSTLTKGSPGKPSSNELNFELQQLLSEAVVGDGVMDVFEIAGLKNPDISVLSDEFLQDVKKLPHKNLALELLRQLINDEIRSKFRLNVVKQRKFSEMLQQSLSRYSNRVIDAAQVIEELIEMAKQFKVDLHRGRQFNLSTEESAFYDALANNQSAQELMGESVLVEIAREAAEKLRANLTVDWAVREPVRAKLRLILRALLRKHKYPPDQQQEAIDLVLRQAEFISESATTEEINSN